MDITGYDTVVFSSASPSGILHSLIPKLLGRWPRLCIDVEPIDSDVVLRDVPSADDCIAAIRGNRR
jgi:hypothetical protein